jgi:multidrug efflux system membrane fusion protein
LLVTLIGTDDWSIAANLREVELDRTWGGECVTGYPIIDCRQAIRGKVESTGWGVLDGARGTRAQLCHMSNLR